MLVINADWEIILKEEMSKEYFQNLMTFIDDEYQIKTVFPEHKNIFKALKITGYSQVKVVIIGQDPYHGENEAQGLSFSVTNQTRRPPSLNNIFKELDSDLKIKRQNNDLSDWANQGVLLLNSILTVIQDQPLSHKDKGWEIFTDEIISKLNERQEPIIFVLWGNYAKSKKDLITNSIHQIIEGVHPSPLSANRGFFGSKPFTIINEFLKKHDYQEINW